MFETYGIDFESYAVEFETYSVVFETYGIISRFWPIWPPIYTSPVILI